MRNYLQKQIKEAELKKHISTKMETSAHDQLIAQLQKYDKAAKEIFITKRRQLDDQRQNNLDLLKYKKVAQDFDKAQSVIIEKDHQSTYENRLKTLENMHIYDIKKIKEDRQRQLNEELSSQHLLKTQSKVLSKLDHQRAMDNEFDLINRNQDRYRQKIKELVERNDKIYNTVYASPYKNLAIAEKERERKLKENADQSFVQEIKRRNMKMDELRLKKQSEYQTLQNAHKEQMFYKQHKQKQSSSIERLQDQQMVANLKTHEEEMLQKEREEEENRRRLCRMNLDEQQEANRSIDPNVSYVYKKEFELSKKLIRDISPPHSTLL